VVKFYFTPSRDAKYYNEYVCMSVQFHVLKTSRPDFTKFSVHLTVVMAQSLTMQYVVYFLDRIVVLCT